MLGIYVVLSIFERRVFEEGRCDTDLQMTLLTMFLEGTLCVRSKQSREIANTQNIYLELKTEITTSCVPQ